MTGSQHCVVLLNGDGPADDFAFLSPMLARNRRVVGRVIGTEPVCVIGYGTGAEPAIRAANSYPGAVLVLVDPPKLAESTPATTVSTLIIAAIDGSESARPWLTRMPDARLALMAARTPLLQHRPAQVLSLIEQFLDYPTRFAAGAEQLEDHA